VKLQLNIYLLNKLFDHWPQVANTLNADRKDKVDNRYKFL